MKRNLRCFYLIFSFFIIKTDETPRISEKSLGSSRIAREESLYPNSNPKISLFGSQHFDLTPSILVNNFDVKNVV